MLARMVSTSGPRDLPALASQSAVITGMSHRAQPETQFFSPVPRCQGLKCHSSHSRVVGVVLQHSAEKHKLKSVTPRKLSALSLVSTALWYISYYATCRPDMAAHACNLDILGD